MKEWSREQSVGWGDDPLIKEEGREEGRDEPFPAEQRTWPRWGSGHLFRFRLKINIRSQKLFKFPRGVIMLESAQCDQHGVRRMDQW